jgi:hypothetical protein
MQKEVRCPACRRLTRWEGNPYRPFCSQRCKLHDLGNWASERYHIPGPPTESTEGAATAVDDDEPERR